MRDSATGRSRGFGFLTFRDPKTVNTVMVKEHYLDGKIVRYPDKNNDITSRLQQFLDRPQARHST
jgi:RNA recognition motif-containing protein